jgi:beta-ureidopropionase / N-carbamoyl-L-amino-acid hydrolase
LPLALRRVWNNVEMLATFSAGGEGVNRLTFSDEDGAVGAYLRAQMVAVGFDVVEVPPGIVLGRLNMPSRSRPVVMSGSYIDVVSAAGRFDGIVRVAGTLEVRRRARQQSMSR